MAIPTIKVTQMKALSNPIMNYLCNINYGLTNNYDGEKNHNYKSEDDKYMVTTELVVRYKMSENSLGFQILGTSIGNPV